MHPQQRQQQQQQQQQQRSTINTLYLYVFHGRAKYVHSYIILAKRRTWRVTDRVGGAQRRVHRGAKHRLDAMSYRTRAAQEDANLDQGLYIYICVYVYRCILMCAWLLDSVT